MGTYNIGSWSLKPSRSKVDCVYYKRFVIKDEFFLSIQYRYEKSAHILGCDLQGRSKNSGIHENYYTPVEYFIYFAIPPERTSSTRCPWWVTLFRADSKLFFSPPVVDHPSNSNQLFVRLKRFGSFARRYAFYLKRIPWAPAVFLKNFKQ